MTLRFGRIVAVPLLILILGLHWAMLQSLAWVSMLVRYSQDNSVAIALQQTFDGKHPCRLCVIIAEGKKAEQEQPQTGQTPTRIELFACSSGDFVFLQLTPSVPQTRVVFAPLRGAPPPLPPPRAC